MADAPSVETDVIIIGGGGSGLAAALEARAAGRAVILLEKTAALGGTTAWSIGSITATRTPDQIRAGIEDSPDAHFEDMPKFPSWREGRDNLELRRLLVDNVTDTLAWLRGHGIEFFGPMSEPPHRVPRMHNVLPNSGAYIHHLGKAARRAGIAIVLNARAKRVMLEEGRAAGIETDIGIFHARHGIVLAGGDYAGSAEYITRMVSAELARVPAVNVNATGDCHRMIEDLGGEIINGDYVLGPRLRFVTPPSKKLHQRIPPYSWITKPMAWALRTLPAAIMRPFVLGFMTTVLGPENAMFRGGALLVNVKGEVCPLGSATPAEVTARQPKLTGSMVFDDSVARRFSAWPNFVSTAPGIAYAYLEDYRRNRPDLCRRADSIADLARQMGVDAKTLESSISAHNAGSAQKCVAPPFYALGPFQAFVTTSEGGVRITKNMEVLTKSGAPIPGLFAAGGTGQGGLLLEGHGHHLGWAFTSGRIAGRNAAAYMPRP